jgi:hypothetical protein
MKQPISTSSKRNCYRCKTPLNFGSFVDINKTKTERWLKKIWNNSSVHLYCCECYEIGKRTEQKGECFIQSYEDFEKGVIEKIAPITETLDIALNTKEINQEQYETIIDLMLRFSKMQEKEITEIIRDPISNITVITFFPNYTFLIFDTESDALEWEVEELKFNIREEGVSFILDWEDYIDKDKVIKYFEGELLLDPKYITDFEVLEKEREKIRDNPIVYLKNYSDNDKKLGNFILEKEFFNWNKLAYEAEDYIRYREKFDLKGDYVGIFLF